MSAGEVSELRAQARPELAGRLHFDSTPAIRRDIARTIPSYAGIEHLARERDQFQYGGPHLCWVWTFATPDGKAHFSPARLPQVEVPEGWFLAATRRGRQFNSMIQGSRDTLTGAARDAVLVSAADAARLGLASGDPVRVANDLGALPGRALVAPVWPGTLQLHWPEAEVLIDRNRRAEAGVPDYNAVVRLERAYEPAGV